MTRPWGIDLAGQTFGRLKVLSEADRVKDRRQWLCQCECGETVAVDQRAMKSGATQSCGCLRREVTTHRMTKHGQAGRGAKSRAYGIWSGMLSRCGIESATGFDRYGAAGITVCDRWREFENFYADMGDPPVGHSIDRIKSECGYEPGNCRWATRQIQNENRKSVRWIEFDGKTMNVTQWARHLGINKATLLEALDKHPIEVALRIRGNNE